MTQRRTVESVASGTLGTALLVAAFLTLVRAEVPAAAVLGRWFPHRPSGHRR